MSSECLEVFFKMFDMSRTIRLSEAGFDECFEYLPWITGPIGPGALRAPAPVGPIKDGKSSKHSSNPASDKRIVRDMSNILKKTSRHSLEIASHQAKLRNIRLFEQPPTRNFETFVKKVRRPSKLSRRSPKVDFWGKLFEISPGRAPDLKIYRKIFEKSSKSSGCVTKVWHSLKDVY